MKTAMAFSMLSLALAVAGLVKAQSSTGAVMPVTVDNFIRAESDTYIAGTAKEAGGIGRLQHRREPASIDNQTVIRLNRDTLYSSVVFDLHAGPATVTLPDAGGRFQSMEIISQDHYATTVYGAGAHTIDKDTVGTRYAVVAIRTLVDTNDPKDVAEVHKRQDAIEVNQKGVGQLALPNWDPASQKKVRDALLVLGSTMPDFKQAFGTREQVEVRQPLQCQGLFRKEPARRLHDQQSHGQ